MDQVAVAVIPVSSRKEPPSSRVDYVVRNDGEVPVWLVDDGWLVWHRDGSHIELSLARAAMRKGAEVFGYFPPAVVQLDPGQAVSRTVELSWPQRLDRLWNDESEAAPPPGEYEVSVRVGYGVTPEPEPAGLDQGVEAPVLEWQREALSPAATLEVLDP